MANTDGELQGLADTLIGGKKAGDVLNGKEFGTIPQSLIGDKEIDDKEDFLPSSSKKEKRNMNHFPTQAPPSRLPFDKGGRSSQSEGESDNIVGKVIVRRADPITASAPAHKTPSNSSRQFVKMPGKHKREQEKEKEITVPAQSHSPHVTTAASASGVVNPRHLYKELDGDDGDHRIPDDSGVDTDALAIDGENRNMAPYSSRPIIQPISPSGQLINQQGQRNDTLPTPSLNPNHTLLERPGTVFRDFKSKEEYPVPNSIQNVAPSSTANDISVTLQRMQKRLSEDWPKNPSEYMDKFTAILSRTTRSIETLNGKNSAPISNHFDIIFPILNMSYRSKKGGSEVDEQIAMEYMYASMVVCEEEILEQARILEQVQREYEEFVTIMKNVPKTRERQTNEIDIPDREMMSATNDGMFLERSRKQNRKPTRVHAQNMVEERRSRDHSRGPIASETDTGMDIQQYHVYPSRRTAPSGGGDFDREHSRAGGSNNGNVNISNDRDRDREKKLGRGDETDVPEGGYHYNQPSAVIENGAHMTEMEYRRRLQERYTPQQIEQFERMRREREKKNQWNCIVQ